MDLTLFCMSLILSIAIGVFCSHIASQRKNRNPTLWFWLGFLLGFAALIVLYFLPVQKKKSRYRLQAAPIVLNNSSLQNPKPLEHEAPKISGYWFYLSPNKEQIGPVNFAEIKQALENGVIHEKSFVWNDQLPAWKRLSELKELAELISIEKI